MIGYVVKGNEGCRWEEGCLKSADLNQLNLREIFLDHLDGPSVISRIVKSSREKKSIGQNDAV